MILKLILFEMDRPQLYPFVKDMQNEDDNPSLQHEINAVSNCIESNVKAIASRGDNINRLEDRVNLLGQHAHDFRSDGNRLRRAMRWKSMRVTVFIVLGVVVLGLVIVLASGQYHTVRVTVTAHSIDILVVLANRGHH